MKRLLQMMAMLLLVLLMGCNNVKPTDEKKENVTLEQTGNIHVLEEEDKYLNQVEIKDFVELIADYDNIEVTYSLPGKNSKKDLEEYTQEELDSLLSAIEEQQTKTEIAVTLLEGSVLNIPEEYAKAKIEEYVEIAKNQAGSTDEDFENYIQSLGYQSEDEYADSIIQSVGSAVPTEVLYLAIAEKENIIKDNGYEEYITAIADSYHLSVDGLYDTFTTTYNSGECYWERNYIIAKTEEMLIKKAKVDVTTDDNTSIIDYVYGLIEE